MCTFHNLIFTNQFLCYNCPTSNKGRGKEIILNPNSEIMIYIYIDLGFLIFHKFFRENFGHENNKHPGASYSKQMRILIEANEALAAESGSTD